MASVPLVLQTFSTNFCARFCCEFLWNNCFYLLCKVIKGAIKLCFFVYSVFIMCYRKHSANAYALIMVLVCLFVILPKRLLPLMCRKIFFNKLSILAMKSFLAWFLSLFTASAVFVKVNKFMQMLTSAILASKGSHFSMTSLSCDFILGLYNSNFEVRSIPEKCFLEVCNSVLPLWLMVICISGKCECFVIENLKYQSGCSEWLVEICIRW